VEVLIDGRARPFFSGLPLVSGDSSDVVVQARSVACVGTVGGLYAANGNDDNDDNVLKGLPFLLQRNAGGPRSCFSGQQLVFGSECTIYGRASGFRTVWAGDDDDECGGNYSSNQLDNDIRNGFPFTCEIGDDLDIDANNESDFYDAIDAMEQRLDDNTDCDTIENGDTNEASFQNAFGNADGTGGLAPDPPPLGGSASPNHVYIQNDCFDNPRIAMLPIIPGNSSSGGDDVAGFALVYITGCYRPSENPSPSTRQTEECDEAENWVEACDNVGSNPFLQWVCDFARQYEVRAIPIRFFASHEALGAIGAANNNAPLTIQTVQ
jgi:hypothetical protein